MITKEDCIKISLKYKNKKEFRDNDSYIYGYSYKRGWLNDICLHMKPLIHPNGYWDREKCLDAAKLCKTRTDYTTKYPGSYLSAKKNGWLDEILSGFEEIRKPKNYWTKERCHDIALMCKSKVEFWEKFPGVASISLSNIWLDDICSHMIKTGNRYKKCIYAYEFSDNHVYIGLTYNINNRQSRHLNDESSAVRLYILKTGISPIFKKLTEYIDVDEAVEMESYYVDIYKESGWYILNRTKTGSIGGSVLKWTESECSKEALKYLTITSFQKGNGSAYTSALKNGWLYQICKHMAFVKNPKEYWTKERCHEEAMKYSTRGEFKKNSSSAYSKSWKNGWLDYVCSHM